MSSSTSSNVVWNNNLFDCEPVWSREPDPSVISTLARDHLDIPESTPISVNFFRQGAFNKLYTIKSNLSKSYIFRVTLPVEPFYKTASEVATLSYLRHHTSIPVANVVAHSTTTENALGFEWILMECLPGVSLRDIWANFPGDKESEETNDSDSLTASALVPWEQKEEISRAVARYLLQLRKISFKAIGSLYLRSDLKEITAIDTEDPQFVIGPLVSMNFFYGGIRSRVTRDLGPYNNEHHYASALTDVVLREFKLAQELDPDDPQYDEDLIDESPEILEAIEMLQSVLDIVFSRETDPAKYILHHHDLSLANILVDPETFKITGIVDWECIGVVPRWADRHPQFLEGPEVEMEVERLQKSDIDVARRQRWENWEKMRLRQVFDAVIREKDEMKREYILNLNIVIIWSRKVIKWTQEIRDNTVLDVGIQSTECRCEPLLN